MVNSSKISYSANSFSSLQGQRQDLISTTTLHIQQLSFQTPPFFFPILYFKGQVPQEAVVQLVSLSSSYAIAEETPAPPGLPHPPIPVY